MRIVLALLLAAGLSAQDSEMLTLKDGRVLTGVYDEARGSLLMENPKAVIAIRKEEIVTREPAQPAAVAEPKKRKESTAEDVDARLAALRKRRAELTEER